MFKASVIVILLAIVLPMVRARTDDVEIVVETEERVYDVLPAPPSLLSDCQLLQERKILRPECPVNKQSLHVLLGLVDGTEAACACRQHGWRLAMVDDGNYQAASQLLRDCLGTQQPVWIHSYGGQWYGGQDVLLGMMHRQGLEKGAAEVQARRVADLAQVLCLE
jgi:hypothetical protein